MSYSCENWDSVIKEYLPKDLQPVPISEVQRKLILTWSLDRIVIGHPTDPDIGADIVLSTIDKEENADLQLSALLQDFEIDGNTFCLNPNIVHHTCRDIKAHIACYAQDLYLFYVKMTTGV